MRGKSAVSRSPEVSSVHQGVCVCVCVCVCGCVAVWAGRFLKVLRLGTIGLEEKKGRERRRLFVREGWTLEERRVPGCDYVPRLAS